VDKARRCSVRAGPLAAVANLGMAEAPSRSHLARSAKKCSRRSVSIATCHSLAPWRVPALATSTRVSDDRARGIECPRRGAHDFLREGSLPEGPRRPRRIGALLRLEPDPAKPDAPAFTCRLFAAGFLQAFGPASGRHDPHLIDPLHYGKAPQRRRNSD
jgi:hypothetical protein